MLAWVDGALVAAGDARVSVFDRGFRSGEGVFETLRSYAGHVFRLDAHLARAVDSATLLRFAPPPQEQLRDAVWTTARGNLAELGGGDAALRLTITPGVLDPESPWPAPPQTSPPTVVVTCSRLAFPPNYHDRGVRAVPVPFGRELPQVKALSYLASSLARATARDRGADEALLTDGSGHVLEGAGSNVFAIEGHRVTTPPLAAGILPGVTRAVVLEVATRTGLEVVEAPLTLEALRSADEAFLTATTREVVPLVGVDAAPIGTGRPGPRTVSVLEAYRDEVRRERAEAQRRQRG